jgi:hypothetical protein
MLTKMGTGNSHFSPAWENILPDLEQMIRAIDTGSVSVPRFTASLWAALNNCRPIQLCPTVHSRPPGKTLVRIPHCHGGLVALRYH